MDAKTAAGLVSRFVGLPAEKRRSFLAALDEQKLDFSVLPIPADLAKGRSSPLSYAQERLWFLNQLEPSSPAYNIASATRLEGPLDLEAMQQSVDELVRRHQALRTTFSEEMGRSSQHVHDARSCPINVVDLSACSQTTDARAAKAKVLAEAEAKEPFDLDIGPLLRITVIKLATDDHVLLLTMHHIGSDGWSMNLVIKELTILYAAYRERRVPALEPLPIQYADYAVWQRAWLEAGESERQLRYWKEQLGDDYPILDLPFDRRRPLSPSNRGGRRTLVLDATLANQLRLLARARGATLFMALLASFEVLLYRHSGQTDLRVGVPVANRGRAETNSLIGPFVNTLVLRTHVSGRLRFSDFLQQVKEAALGAQAHQDLPFERLVEALRPLRSLASNPLFQVMFNHQQRDYGALTDLLGLRSSTFATESAAAQFDLCLDTEEDETGKVVASFSYARDLFDDGTIARLATHWLATLKSVVGDDGVRIDEIELLTSQEREQRVAWNAPKRRYARDIPVHEWISHRAAMTPSAEAVECDGERITYAELDWRANQVAHGLLARGVAPESVVAIAVERSITMIVGLLGILKSGGAYLPLDPSYPAERLRYMLEDADAVVLVTERRVHAVLDAPASLPLLFLDGDAMVDAPEGAPSIPVHPENLAYVIYTSGSTGRPKGVAVPHGALVMHCQAIADAYVMTSSDTMFQFASISFDGAVDQWIAPLMRGARVVLRGPELGSAEETFEKLGAEGVTIVDILPSYLLELAHWGNEHGRTVPLRICAVGGEALPREGYELLRHVFPSSRVVNGYGPTETIVTPMVWAAADGESCDTAYAPIGRAVGERTTQILDADLNLCPVGVAGELYIGGVGVARGYHGRAPLTAERFVPDAWGEAGGRLYRTGDVARYRTDGTVEYLGRADEQVKVRGYRVELGEIEAQLLGDERVREVAVIVCEERSGKRIVAYLVTRPDAKAHDLAVDLRRNLTQRLPEYMVPSAFVMLEELPRTPGGKVDRKALPAPELPVREHIAPRTAVEKELASIWQTILGIERVGATDNFFELGGDSIVSIQVVSCARQAGLRLTPKDIFAHPTLEALARIARPLETAGSACNVEPARGEVPLLPIQAAFFEQSITERHHWNQAVMLQADQTIEEETLVRVLDALLEHHDALRLRFTHAGGKWTQRYAEASQVRGRDALWVCDQCAAGDIEGWAERAQRSLDLEKGPLLRAALMKLDDGSARLLLVAHHLVVDGVSWRILLEDLQTAYRQSETGAGVVLAPRTSSYQAWSRAIRAMADDPALAEQVDHWESAIGRGPTDLPRDFPEDIPTRRDATTLTLRLDRVRTAQLLQIAPAAYRTKINDLLLTAVARVLARFTGRALVPVELEGHGREELFDGIDLARSVGWFTATFPVGLPTTPDLPTTILSIKEHLRQIPQRGIGFGVLQHLAVDPIHSRMAALPRPRVTFNYLGQFDATFREGALFRPAKESAGERQSPNAPLGNWLEINGQVYDGALLLGWTFSSAMFRSSTMQSLVDQCHDELIAVIDHCLQGEKGGVSPSDFPLARLSLDELRSLPFPPRRVEDVYPLTPLQQGMLFHALFAPETPVYVTQLDVAVAGLDPHRLLEAWRATFAEHAILRTAFVWQGLPHPVQVVLDTVQFTFEQLDWSQTTEESRRIDELRRAEHARGIALDAPPLQRVVLVRLPEGRHHLVWTSHHLLLDGWSSALLLAEILRRYAHSTAAPSGAMSVAARPDDTKHGGVVRLARYRDYIAWIASRDAAGTENFWRERLRHIEEATLLASAVGTRKRAQGHGARSTRLSNTLVKAVHRFSQEEQMTVSTLLQGAWALLLQRYTQQSSVVFGLTVAGRPPSLSGADSLLGLFINTLPVAPRWAPGDSIAGWLRELQTSNAELGDHEHAPLYEIQGWAGRPGRALFDTVLVFENYPVDTALRGRDTPLRFGDVRSIDTTNYPLTLNIVARDGIGIQYQYARAEFDDDVIERLGGQFEALLEQIVDNPSQCIGEVRLARSDEQARSAAEVTEAPADWHGEPVHLSIARQAQVAPGMPALWCAGKTLSYGELEHLSNRVAHGLCRLGVRPDVPVGLLIERSFDMVVGILAILKAGGAYVPLEPDAPDERIGYMLATASVGVVVTQRRFVHRLHAVDVQTLVLDSDEAIDEPSSLPDVQLSPDNLAYVIYTSGSTGRPKGAANTHAGLSNRLRWMQHAYELGPDETVLQKTPFGFDVSVWEFLWPLMVGARLVLAAPGEHRDPALLVALIREQGVTTVHFVPSMLGAFLEAEGVNRCSSLRRIVASGEELPVDVEARAFERLPAASLYNLYGPTEASIDVTHWTCSATPATDATAVPIGRPIAHTVVRVLDRDLNDLPPGVAGELYIGGIGLARGYYGQPALTAERFVPDAESIVPGARLYRTGDRAALREDGSLTFLGRLDNQVKVRGFRVELGEIERHLLGHGDVAQAVTVVRQDQAAAHLLAYAVPRPGVPRDDLVDRLTRYLRLALPEYMVPSRFVFLDALPRLPNGKIDRKSLTATGPAEETREAPRGGLEETLASMWQDLLGLSQVGRQDHFFELGGHSLLAVQLVSRIKHTLGVDVTLREVFDAPRLEALARTLNERLTVVRAAGREIENDVADAMDELEAMSAQALEALLAGDGEKAPSP